MSDGEFIFLICYALFACVICPLYIRYGKCYGK